MFNCTLFYIHSAVPQCVRENVSMALVGQGNRARFIRNIDNPQSKHKCYIILHCT